MPAPEIAPGGAVSRSRQGSSGDAPRADLLTRLLKTKREAFLDRHFDAGDPFARLFSAATYSLWRSSRAIMAEHCRGLTLDAGSGRGTWRRTILELAREYESIDVAPRGDFRPTFVGDLTDMSQVQSGRYDTVVCHQVLEHVRDPFKALSEMRRVLGPGGRLILSVPHLSRRHELPNDYFRFTQEGVSALLESAGFEVLEIQVYGGFLSFFHHQSSFLFPGLFLGIPIVDSLAVCANAPFSWLFPLLDRAVDRNALLPLGIMAVGLRT